MLPRTSNEGNLGEENVLARSPARGADTLAAHCSSFLGLTHEETREHVRCGHGLRRLRDVPEDGAAGDKPDLLGVELHAVDRQAPRLHGGHAPSALAVQARGHDIKERRERGVGLEVPRLDAVLVVHVSDVLGLQPAHDCFVRRRPHPPVARRAAEGQLGGKVRRGKGPDLEALHASGGLHDPLEAQASSPNGEVLARSAFLNGSVNQSSREWRHAFRGAAGEEQCIELRKRVPVWVAVRGQDHRRRTKLLQPLPVAPVVKVC
mmetsp:Transcript_141413/g.452014  ORF Transcript_141413/g.452014 Transcript_141413/m.452014 type:complete len:263 (-) Transcript_141413:234-1022(-)